MYDAILTVRSNEAEVLVRRAKDPKDPLGRLCLQHKATLKSYNSSSGWKILDFTFETPKAQGPDLGLLYGYVLALIEN